MPIPLHLALLFVANIAALIGGFILGMSTHEAIRSSLPEVLQVKEVAFIAFGMAPAALALLVTGIIFRHLIVARCPKCHGRFIYHASRKEKNIFGGYDSKPITYHCKECGHVHRTRIYPARPTNPH